MNTFKIKNCLFTFSKIRKSKYSREYKQFETKNNLYAIVNTFLFTNENNIFLVKINSICKSIKNHDDEDCFTLENKFNHMILLYNTFYPNEYNSDDLFFREDVIELSTNYDSLLEKTKSLIIFS